jgi:hypothetical protein
MVELPEAPRNAQQGKVKAAPYGGYQRDQGHYRGRSPHSPDLVS